jgi:hypothetical protein
MVAMARERESAVHACRQLPRDTSGCKPSPPPRPREAIQRPAPGANPYLLPVLGRAASRAFSHHGPPEELEHMSKVRSELIDELMDMYVEWREACIALRVAYEHWSSVRVAERKLAFATYEAALDWEEQASAIYADRINQVARELPGVPEPVRS